MTVASFMKLPPVLGLKQMQFKLADADTECKHIDPNAFFISDHATPEAMLACNRCPLRRECWIVGALTRSEGVWGGVHRPHNTQVGRALRLSTITDVNQMPLTPWTKQ